MSNVIGFLERMGQDAQLRYATSNEVERALRQAEIDPALQAAILGGDQHRMEVLLGAKTNVCCMVHAPENDDDAEQGKELTPRQSAVPRRASAI